MGLFSWLFGKKKKNKKEEANVAVATEAKEPVLDAEPVPAEPVVDETPAEPVADETPVEDDEPVADETPAEDDEPVADETPAEDDEPEADETPAEDAEPEADETPAEDAEPEADETPAEVKPAKITGRFEINKTKDGKKYFFNLYASNKVGIATSQMYSSAQNALNGVKSVINNAPKAAIEDQSLKTYETLPYPKWEIYIDNGGKFRFRLRATNGSCVCHSQGYTSKTNCKNGIDSIIRSSRNAEIDKAYIIKKDQTQDT